MALTDLFDRIRTGVVHICFIRGGNRVASGTGFLVNDRLVTNNHVFRGPDNCEVLVRFADSDPNRMEDGFILPLANFRQRLISGSDEHNFDFAILDVPELLPGRFQFRFSERTIARVGMKVAFFGYPLEHLNLVCHAGIISSIYMRGQVEVLQLDASVNSSNSGGPLVDLETETVVGIVTRKATGLTAMFEELRRSFDENVRALEAARGMIGLGTVDPIAALIAGQRQMQHLTSEIERSANVGIAYAFSSQHVSGDPAFQRA